MKGTIVKHHFFKDTLFIIESIKETTVVVIAMQGMTPLPLEVPKIKFEKQFKIYSKIFAENVKPYEDSNFDASRYFSGLY